MHLNLTLLDFTEVKLYDLTVSRNKMKLLITTILKKQERFENYSYNGY